MKITKILTASAVALTLAFGTVISASAADFDKDSVELEKGLTMRPGDTITTEGTSQNMRFDTPITIDYYNDGNVVREFADDWSVVQSFYYDESSNCIILNYDIDSKVILNENQYLVVKYDKENDLWHADLTVIERTDLDDCYVELDHIAKTVTVKIGDADGEEVSADNYTVEYYGVDNDYEGTEYPETPGKYNLVITADENSLVVKGVNDSVEFTVEEEEESSEESSEETSEDTSEETSEDTSEETSEAESSAADSSSKAASDSSTKNPGTGTAAAAMGIISVAAAGIAVSRKRK